MHKSKGLEFPVVFIANTTSLYNEKEVSDKLLTSSTLGIGIDVLDKTTGVIYPSIIKQVIKQDPKDIAEQKVEDKNKFQINANKVKKWAI